MTNNDPRMRGLKKKATLKSLEKMAVVATTVSAMLGGDYRPYKSLRNKEHFLT